MISHGLKESDTTERLNWTELALTIHQAGYWKLLFCFPQGGIIVFLANHHALSSDITPCLPELVLPDTLGSAHKVPVAEMGVMGLVFMPIWVTSAPGREIPGDGTLRGLWDVFLLSTILLITFKFFCLFPNILPAISCRTPTLLLERLMERIESFQPWLSLTQHFSFPTGSGHLHPINQSYSIVSWGRAAQGKFLLPSLLQSDWHFSFHSKDELDFCKFSHGWVPA